MLETLLVFHLEILGMADNFEHLKNINLILTTLLVLHFEILGNSDKDEHLTNIPLISYHISNIISIPF